jgi:polysaccharide export outer membrane protein
MKTNEKAHTRYRAFVLRGIIALAVASCAAYGANSQTSRPNQNGQAGGPSPTASVAQPGRSSTAVLVSPEEDYRIGPNDVIDVQIENAPEMSRSFRVTAAGTFLMPYVGRIAAVKKTTEELAQFIAEKLRGDYLKDPKVTVSVKEYNSRSFFVQGSVRSPGVYQIEGKPSMLELLTLAGGLSEHHGANAFIIRRIKNAAQKDPEADHNPETRVAAAKRTASEQDATEESPKYELKSVNVNGLLKGHFEQDAVLEPGDIVNIPETDLFFVAGEVNAPGQFNLKEGTTLRQAISLAQGTNYKAALDRGIIFRENVAGKREELRINIGDVMSGKKQDINIMANDIIMVPNSKARSIGGAILKAFGMNTITRLPLF